jgi:anthranilate synthase/aminodeoxychorismate synthase-like glutamine amidotransferase
MARGLPRGIRGDHRGSRAAIHSIPATVKEELNGSGNLNGEKVKKAQKGKGKQQRRQHRQPGFTIGMLGCGTYRPGQRLRIHIGFIGKFLKYLIRKSRFHWPFRDQGGPDFYGDLPCPGLTCRAMVLVIDNYDSFTYNLVQYLGELNAEMEVHRNDQITVEQASHLRPERILVSPGPCSPRESGLSNDIIREFTGKVPIFGVCLGHQCIGHTFGANVIVNYRMMHGKTSLVKHNEKDLFRGMPNPFPATRYHSLVIERSSLPDCLEITAETDEGEIMGVRHKDLPVWGVQFHPESILTENGRRIMKNFLELKA